MKKICIVYGGPSSEHDVSVDSTKALINNINKEKYSIFLLYIDRNLVSSLEEYSSKYIFSLKAETPLFDNIEKLKEFDLCIIAMHGEFGEDGSFQTLLELNNISYTGSNVYSSRLCMDKYRSSLLVKHCLDIDIPITTLANINEIEKLEELEYPLILKPNKLGSSVGVHSVSNKDELLGSIDKIKNSINEKEEYLVQEAIVDNIELSCGVLQKKDGSYIGLPPIEIHPKRAAIFDYDSKYIKGGAEEIVPPVSIKKELSEKITELSIEIHKLLGCRLYSRSDFLISKDILYYLETNTLPGLTSTSLLPQECAYIGISYPELIDFLIENSI